MKKIEKLNVELFRKNGAVSSRNYYLVEKINDLIDNQNEMIEKLKLDNEQQDRQPGEMQNGFVDEKPEPEKQMMICENWKECSIKHKADNNHCDIHEKNNFCNSKCTASWKPYKCIPYTESDWQKELEKAKNCDCSCYFFGQDNATYVAKDVDKKIQLYESVIEKMAKEIEKQKHDYNISQGLIKNALKVLKEKDAELVRLKNLKEICQNCGKNLEDYSMYCKECYRLNKKREIPEELIDWLKSLMLGMHFHSTVNAENASQLLKIILEE